MWPFTCIILLFSPVKVINNHTAVSNSYIESNCIKPLQDGVLFLEDHKNNYTPLQVYNNSSFKLLNSDIPGFNSSSTVWVKVRIQNLSDSHHLLLKLSQPNIEEVVFYTFQDTTYRAEVTGINYPFHQRKYKNQNFLFDINIKKGEVNTYLLKLKTTGQLQIPLWIGSYAAMYQSLQKEDLYMTFYAGIILAMLLYNLFICLTVHTRIYYLYVLNIIIVSITQMSFQGYTYRFLWPDAPFLATHALVVLTSIAGITAMSFIRAFLQLPLVNPILDKIMKGFIFSYTPMIILTLIGYENISYQIARIITLFSVAFSLYAIYWVYRKGSRAASFLLIAWITFLIGTLIFALKDISILPYNDFTNNTMLIGSVLELLLLSFALADRINQSKRLAESLLIEQQENQKLQLEKQQVQQEALQMELGFLKNQINHHFIFNTINAFYDRALDTDEVLAESIAKFSDIIGYSLKDTQKLIPLSEEISYIQNYIDIYQLRYSNRLCIELTVEGDTHFLIPPLILVTFVENGFKHGDLQNAQQPLQISICCRNDLFFFRIHNKKGGHTVTYSGGIGFENIEKRLKLYYNERFTLERQDDGDTFTCLLRINQISKIDYTSL